MPRRIKKQRDVANVFDLYILLEHLKVFCYILFMKLAGNPEGLDELKFIKENKLFYLKYLLKEAQTSTYRMVEFKGQDGRKKFRLKYFPDKDEFLVERIDEGTSS